MPSAPAVRKEVETILERSRQGSVASMDDMIQLSRRQLAVLVVPLAALLVVAGRQLGDRGAGAPVARPVAVERSAAGPEPERIELVVHVAGAVEQPGLYHLPEGARVSDAVEAAGGLKPRADLAAVNLAAPLADGQHVVVTRRAPPGAAPGGAAAAASAGPVPLSSATVEQLDELPGIGPVTAQKIVDWRTAHGGFRSVDDLDAIPGIGPSRIEQLRDLVVP